MRVLVLLLGATALAAQEPDAAIAPASRWTDVRGTASGGLRSRARPLLHDIEEAFRIQLPGVANHAPVHWDGLAYLLCGPAAERTLVAVDLYLGKIVAKKTVRTRSIHPVVWNNVVVLNEETQLVGYRRSKRSFRPVWKSKAGAYTDPVVWDGEIYVVADERLERLRMGHRSVDWAVGAGLRGRPAVYGNAVYVAGHEHPSGYYPFLQLQAYDRRTGSLIASVRCGQYAEGKDQVPEPEAPFAITVSEQTVYVRPPRPLAGQSGSFRLAAVARLPGGARLRLGEASLSDFDVAPAAHARGVIVRTTKKGELRWERWFGGRIHLIASSKAHPDLVARRVPATVLGDVVYFGSWAADIRSFEVLWRLPGADGNFPVVPAEGLALVVDGRLLRAFHEKGAK